MSCNQLAQQMIWWQEQDAQSLSINKKCVEKQASNKETYGRYFLFEEAESAYFTIREMEIALHLFEHLTYKCISEKMGLSDRTVECHVRRMRLKLGCKDRIELINTIQFLPIFEVFKKEIVN